MLAEAAGGASAEGQMKKLWWIHTVELRSTLKQNETVFLGPWIEFVVLSKTSQAQKTNVTCLLSLKVKPKITGK